MLTNLSPKVLKDASVNKKIPTHTIMNPRNAPKIIDAPNLIAFFILYLDDTVHFVGKGKSFIGNASYWQQAFIIYGSKQKKEVTALYGNNLFQSIYLYIKITDKGL